MDWIWFLRSFTSGFLCMVGIGRVSLYIVAHWTWKGTHDTEEGPWVLCFLFM